MLRFGRRLFSTTRPPIYEVLPKKKLLNRVLFDLDSRHGYAKLFTAYESIYKRLDTDEEPDIPRYINASDLMIMKKALENVRIMSHTANRHLVDLENELVEKAAEHGNNDAVALLSFEAIVNEKADVDDKVHAKKLVAKLLELKHPLTIKLSGDLCLKNEMIEQAVKFYNQFLALENDTFLASEVYKQLGILNFQKPNLVLSKQYFERSVKTGPIDKVADCHYYLGQLNIHEPKRARHHFELSASQGFKESFQQLGFLEMNFFGNSLKAREWFKLGSEVSDISCIIGLFDCSIKEQKWKEAYRIFSLLENSLPKSKDEDNIKVWDHFLDNRKRSIALMNENYQPMNKTIQKIHEFQSSNTTTNLTPEKNAQTNNDRWRV
jgi:protein MSS2